MPYFFFKLYYNNLIFLFLLCNFQRGGFSKTFIDRIDIQIIFKENKINRNFNKNNQKIENISALS